jgi:hypothetical protein
MFHYPQEPIGEGEAAQLAFQQSFGLMQGFECPGSGCDANFRQTRAKDQLQVLRVKLDIADSAGTLLYVNPVARL